MSLSNQVLTHLVRTAAVIHRNGADSKFRREILINGYQRFSETFRELCNLLFLQSHRNHAVKIPAERLLHKIVLLMARNQHHIVAVFPDLILQISEHCRHKGILKGRCISFLHETKRHTNETGAVVRQHARADTRHVLHLL